MHGRLARGAITRKTAMILGITCSLVAIGGVLSFYFNTGSGSNSGNQSATTGNTGGAAGGPPDVPIDVGLGGIGKTGRAMNELVDQKNPGRVKAHISWKQLDPLPKGQYSIVEPRAWIYLEDGRTLELWAATGTIRFTGDSKQRRPESGQFEGGVQVRVFAPGAKPASVVVAEASRDAEAASITPPMLLAFTESMNFDTLTNDYSTTDRVMIGTGQTEAELSGLHIVYNDVLGRPDLIETTAGFMRFTKTAKKTAAADAEGAMAAAPGVGTPAGTATGGAASPTPRTPAPSTSPPTPVTGPAKAQKIDFYRADIAQAVELSTRGQTITSDKMLVWARLIDGKLSDAALGNTPAQAAPSGSTPASTTLPTVVPPTPPAIASQSPATNPTASATQPVEPKPQTGPTIRDRLTALRAMPSDSPKSITPVRDDDILLVWTGPMSVYSLESPPPELAKDDVAARFIAEGVQPVKMSDKRNAEGAEGPYAECMTLEYGATTKNAVLSGMAPGSVHLVDPKNKRNSTVNQFELNLASGIGHVPGPGILSAARDAKSTTPAAASPDASSGASADVSQTNPVSSERTLAWSDSADFQFDVGGKTPGEAGIRSLREASFTGTVAASDGRASINGDFLHAWFSPMAQRDTAFSRVVVEGTAVGETRSADSREEFKRLAADRFDVAFKPAPDGKDMEPSILTATGHVTGEQHEYKKAADTAGTPSAAGAVSAGTPAVTTIQQPTLQTTTLTSGFLEANLVTKRDGDKKRTDVSDAYAKDKVYFARSDGITADADELRAQLDSKLADLAGKKVVIARGGSSVSGTAMRLDGKENSLLVKSGGEIDHDQPQTETETKPRRDEGAEPRREERKGKSIGHVHITWSTSMSYNDTTGIGTCEGDAVVTQDQDALHHSTVRAEQVALYMEPVASRKTSAPQGGDPLAIGASDARLLRAEAIGSGESPDRRAKVESREYALDAAAKDGRKLERLTYIEGVRVIADEEHGVFEVPTAGKALVLDHRASEAVRISTPSNPSSIPIIPSSNPRGTTLFVWTGWMKLNRATSIVEMQDGVELTHKPLDETQQPIKLTASHVEGHLRAKDPAAGSLPGLAGLDREQLVKAIATGSVVVQTVTEDMRLSAGEVEYDAETQMLTASSPPGETQGVEYIDLRRAAPVIGKKLIVILKPDGKHEVAIIEPMPVTVPIK